MKPKVIFSIAKNTYREIIRDRLLYGIFIIAALLTASSFFMATISFEQNGRVLQNLGLAMIHVFTAFICIFVTTNSLNRDVERRALYFLLSKPISRAQYVVGKYFGFLLLLLTTLLILGGLFTIGLFFTDKGIISASLINFGYSFLEISLLIALGVLFGSFTAPLNATLYTTALFFVGHSLTTLKEFVDKSGVTATKWLMSGIYYLLPNLEKFDVRTATLYHIHIAGSQVFWSLFYWVLYTTALLVLASVVMRKREF